MQGIFDLAQKAAIRRPKLTRPTTADARREISCFALKKAGGFDRPMRFPFQHIETARDHVRIFTPGNRNRPPEIVAVDWRRMTFGLKPFFICPRCNARRWFLYFDGLCAYCRVCADFRFASQRQRRRTRLLHRSHRIRAALGDQTGKPGDLLPAKPYNQWQSSYRKTITKLRLIEGEYLHTIAADRRRIDRERDELGRFVPVDDTRPDADETRSADDFGR